MTPSVLSWLQGVSMLVIAPGLLGFLNWLKAHAQGRNRQFITLWQPYRNLLRLVRQPTVHSKGTTVVFAAAPVVLWACYGTLAFAVPLLGQPPLLEIDLITMVYLLALARLTLALAGLDSGAPFGALGSARSMFLSVPTELALVLIGTALALHWHTLSLIGLMTSQWQLGWSYPLRADLLLIGFAFYLTLSLKVGRIPIDNPGTHLELTMSQKAILLEYAGCDLALIEWAEAIKLGVLLSLFSVLFIMPLTLAPATDVSATRFQAWLGAGCMVSPLLVVLFLARMEAKRPKMRLRKTRDRAVIAAGLSLAAILYRMVYWVAP